MTKLTIKQRLFDLLNTIDPDREWTKKELVKYLDIIRGVNEYCQYQYSFEEGNGFHKPGYLRIPSKTCPYFLEKVRRGVYRVAKCDTYEPKAPVSEHIEGNQYQYVLDKIDDEGFHYAITSYSSFKEVGDNYLLEMIKEYKTIVGRISDYLETMARMRGEDMTHFDPEIDPLYWEVL